jgi:hypothetical protein
VRLAGRRSPTDSSDRALRSKRPERREIQFLSDNTVRKVSVARVMAPRVALVSARALSMTKSWMMAWKRADPAIQTVLSGPGATDLPA